MRLPLPPTDRAALLASRHEIRRARGVLQRLITADPTMKDMIDRLGDMVTELEIELDVCEAEEAFL